MDTNRWTLHIDFWDDDTGWRHKWLRWVCPLSKDLRVTHCAPRFTHPKYGSYTIVTGLGKYNARLVKTEAYHAFGTPKFSYTIQGSLDRWGPGKILQDLEDREFHPSTLACILWWYTFWGPVPDSCVTACHTAIQSVQWHDPHVYQLEKSYPTPWDLLFLLEGWSHQTNQRAYKETL